MNSAAFVAHDDDHFAFSGTEDAGATYLGVEAVI